MKYAKVVLSTLFLASAFGCRGEENLFVNSLQATVYQYKAYDLDSTLVATGTLSLVIDAAVISGQREIKGSGPEAGSGEIEGVLDRDGSMQIVLSPGQISVILEGKPLGMEITGGRWFDTGGPPIARMIGFFIATRADMVLDKTR